MKLNKTLYLLALIVLVAIPTVTFAQAPVPAGQAPLISRVPVLYPQSFPGQAWEDLGNISPVEHNDVISATYVEQGVTLYRAPSYNFEAFGSVGVTADTLGYVWNNRVVGSAGGRFNYLVGTKGIIEVNATYTYEDRFLSSQTAGGFTPSVDYWFGWHPIANTKSRFPGSTWGAAGLLSPVEHNNFIFNQYAKQGVVAKRFGSHTALQPYAEITTSVDTSRYDWENYVRPGAGIELVYTKGNSMTELGGGYVYEHRTLSGLSAGGYSVFMKFWLGWNPIRGGKH
jgi:hypothetical protein